MKNYDINYPIVIPIPCSAILIGTNRVPEFIGTDIISEIRLVPLKEYYLSCDALTFTTIIRQTNPCIESLQDGILTIKHNNDKQTNELIDSLIGSFLIYQNGEPSDTNSIATVSFIPFMPTSYILESLFTTTNILNEKYEIKESYIRKDIINMERQIIKLKTELSIRDLYAFSFSELLQYFVIINDYHIIRKKLVQDHRIFDILCKTHTIKVVE